MIDTNAVNQAAQVAQDVRTQLSPWVPALAVASAWLGRELNRLSAWSAGAAERLIAHGGLLRYVLKIFWVRGYKPEGGGK